MAAAAPSRTFAGRRVLVTGGAGFVGSHVADHGWPHRPAHERKDEGEDHGGEDEVHPGPGKDDEKARPQGLEGKGLGRVIGEIGAALQRVLLAKHLHVPAHRDGAEAVFRLFPAPAQQHGTEPDGEAFHAHPGRPGHREVPELMEQDEDPDDDDE